MGKLLIVLLATAALLLGCTGAQLKEGVAADGHAYRGAASPKVVIYEYSDFECPFCGRAVPVVDEIVRAHENDVQLQFRNFPLTDIHPRSMPSALAGVCADEQGKFWQMHDRMFANQDKLEDADLKKYAQEIGLGAANFTACLGSQEAFGKVQQDIEAGKALGVQGTPSFEVGSTLVVGTPKLQQVVEAELARAG